MVNLINVGMHKSAIYDYLIFFIILVRRKEQHMTITVLITLDSIALNRQSPLLVRFLDYDCPEYEFSASSCILLNYGSL